MPLGVTRREAAFAGLNPGLEKVERLGGTGIKLAVRHASSGAHELNLSRLKHAAVAHAVLVLQSTFQHVTKNFHITMRMRAETLAGRDAIIVDDAQRTEAHVRRIVIISKGKGVMRIQPAVVGTAAFVRPSDIQFGHCRFHVNRINVSRKYG